jgi:hypothetical protein
MGWLPIMQLQKNLTKVVEDTSDQVGLSIKDMQRSLSSLACMVMDHHLALDFLLAKQGGVCAIANTSCYTYINTSGIVEEHADYILQQAKWFPVACHPCINIFFQSLSVFSYYSIFHQIFQFFHPKFLFLRVLFHFNLLIYSCMMWSSIEKLIVFFKSNQFID